MALTRTERRGDVLLLGLCRPDRHNALDAAMVEEIDAVLAAARREPCVLVVHSTTAGMFAAEADLADRDADATPRAVDAGLFERLEAHPWPTIAVVDGPAYGGACQLALACDLRVASPRARFAQPGLGAATPAGAAASWRLPHTVGLPVARRMLYTGEVLDAEAAFAAGLVDVISSDQDVLGVAMAVAARIVTRSWRALEVTKRALRPHGPATTSFDLARALLLDEADQRDRVPEGQPSGRPTAASPSALRGADRRLVPSTPFRVRQLTIEDGMDLAAWRYPGAWGVQDALEPPQPDEGYWTVVDGDDRLVGYCCLGEAARVTGAPSDSSVLDVSIGIRPDLAGKGWGGELGRAAVDYARGVALDRRLRTTVPEWNEVASHVARECGFGRVGTRTYGHQRFVVLEQGP